VSRFALASLFLAAACRALPRDPTADEPVTGPYAVLLGLAQDGGRPQIGCELDCCRDLTPAERVPVVALLVVDPRSGRRWLLDASPDVGTQLRLEGARQERPVVDGRRPPLVDGIFLTHAHMGHYAGLLAFGREAYGSAGLRLHASERMGAFLRANAPWNALLARGEASGATLETLVPGRPVTLADDLVLTALAVPHRDELSDTLAFRVQGPRGSILYAPDTDGWEHWDPRVETVLAGVDVALLDATFFGPGELPGRDLAAVPHPFLRDSIARFAELPAAQRDGLRFIHLNHSNPAWNPDGPERAALRAAGLALGRVGERFEL
jgi:pyrroloquinoline quinone biosynthesis protein B